MTTWKSIIQFAKNKMPNGISNCQEILTTCD